MKYILKKDITVKIPHFKSILIVKTDYLSINYVRT